MVSRTHVDGVETDRTKCHAFRHLRYVLQACSPPGRSHHRSLAFVSFSLTINGECTYRRPHHHRGPAFDPHDLAELATTAPHGVRHQLPEKCINKESFGRASFTSHCIARMMFALVGRLNG